MYSNFARIFVLFFTANSFGSVLCGVTNRVGQSPTPSDQQSAPWINSNKFQGDIANYDQKSFDALVGEIAKWQTRREQNKGNNSALESAISDPRGLWTNGIVPYVFDSSDPETRTAVLAAMKDFQDTTCIRFVERTNEPNYVKIIDNEDGCWAVMGNARNGAQKLNLGSGCRTKGTALHELMHALGFWHEQQRYDRDSYIIVYPENATEGTGRDQYKKADNKDMKLIGNYDMDSVMHYPSWGFALPGKITMKAKNSDRTKFGGEEITKEDIHKLRMLYNCADDTRSEATIVSGIAYYIIAAGTKNCLDVPGSYKDAIQLQQWDCNHTPAQQWILAHIKGNVYSVVNVGTLKAMDVNLIDADNEGGKVIQYTAVIPPSENQQFVFTPHGDHFRISGVVNGKSIWPDGEGKICHWNDASNHDWALERVCCVD